MSKRWTKHVFPVNLAQIRSAVPEIFDSQTNKKVTDSATQSTACGNNTWTFVRHNVQNKSSTKNSVILAKL